jgi:predicted nucleic acid-binding protein
MTVVLDTSVLIDVLRGHEGAVAYLAAAPGVPTCSQITRVEVLRGMRSDERSATLNLLYSLSWADVDERVAIRAGELGRRYRRSHPSIGSPDLIIAATAQVLGLPLATTNVRHFPMFRRLRPPY